MGPVNLGMDLHITHKHWGSSSNAVLMKTLHYPLPFDIDKTLNEDTPEDKIRDYRVDYNNRVMGT